MRRPVEAAHPWPSAGGELADADFERLRTLVHRESGIWLADHKKSLLVCRLSGRLRALRVRDWRDYLRVLFEDQSGEELKRMLDCVSTNETHFFREPGHFEFLSQQLLPAWRLEMEAGRRPRRVRAWSAACSTGEEPYSLAMVLLDTFGVSERAAEVTVLGSDLSTRVLARAEAATWPLAREQEIPLVQRRRYLLRGVASQSGQIRVAPEVRQVVRLRRLNLVSDPLPEGGPFDLLFCRNALIYFDAETRARVLERLLRAVAPGGYFFLGHAEALGKPWPDIESVLPSVYRRCTSSGRHHG